LKPPTPTSQPLPATPKPSLAPAIAPKESGIMDSIIPQASASGEYNEIDMENIQKLKDL
jgi:hypothetical protein